MFICEKKLNLSGELESRVFLKLAEFAKNKTVQKQYQLNLTDLTAMDRFSRWRVTAFAPAWSIFVVTTPKDAGPKQARLPYQNRRRKLQSVATIPFI